MTEKKATIYDIAAATGVSVATVHRALNDKTRIHPETKERILETAKQLGYKVNVAAQGLRRLPIRIGAVLFCPVEDYVDAIVDGIAAAGGELEKYNVSVDIHKLPYTTTEECLKQSCTLIRELTEAGCQGIILFMSATTGEMQELMEIANELSERRVCFATVANDLPDLHHDVHVGVDAHMAGRMAAELLGMRCQGKEVALWVASRHSPVNTEYIKGFDSYAKNNFFSAVHVYEHLDDAQRVAEATQRMLSDHPDLAGVYMTTASSALACRTIRDAGKNLTVVTTDVLRETPAFLGSGVANAAIFQNPYRQGKNVVRHLYNHMTAHTDDGVHLICPQIVLSSNIEAYLSPTDDNVRNEGY